MSWVLMIVVIKPCPLLFVFFCSCGECCPPNNACSDKAGTPSVLLNELQKQCGHNSYSLGSHNLWLCCLFFCHLSICFTLEQIDFHINSKFSQRTNRRESFFRLNASNNFPPGPLMLVTQPPLLGHVTTADDVGFADYSVLHTEEERQTKAGPSYSHIEYLDEQ